MVLKGQASLVDALGALVIQDASHVVLSCSYEGPSLAGRRSYTVFPRIQVEPHRLGMQLQSARSGPMTSTGSCPVAKTVRLSI